METRRIGSLEVSVVGLGCNNFGMRIDEAATERVVDAAIEHGINFFDTADIYGGTKSEEYLGRILKGGKRDQIVLATKFGMEVDPQKKGAGPDYVKQAAEDSLRRLQTDRIDLYQLHEPDDSVPIADTLGALNELVEQGKVREIGCSNFSPEQLREAHAAAKGARFASVQNEYSLLKREPENGVIAECAKLGMALIPYFPLASGLLSGKYRKGQPLPEGTRINAESRWMTEENLELVEKLHGYAEGNGRTILDLAFGYLLSTGVVASVIAGATKPEQIESNVRAGTAWRLNAQQMEEVRGLLTPAVV